MSWFLKRHDPTAILGIAGVKEIAEQIPLFLMNLWLLSTIGKGLSPVTRNLSCQSTRGNRSGWLRYKAVITRYHFVLTSNVHNLRENLFTLPSFCLDIPMNDNTPSVNSGNSYIRRSYSKSQIFVVTHDNKHVITKILFIMHQGILSQSIKCSYHIPLQHQNITFHFIDNECQILNTKTPAKMYFTVRNKTDRILNETRAFKTAKQSDNCIVMSQLSLL